MANGLALLGYAGLVALMLPSSLRRWFAGWIVAAALLVGLPAVPLAVVMFIPVAFLSIVHGALHGRSA